MQSIEFVGIYLIRHQYNRKLYLWETFRVFEWICIDIIASNDRKVIVCLLASLYGKTLSTSLVMVLCFHPFFPRMLKAFAQTMYKNSRFHG